MRCAHVGYVGIIATVKQRMVSWSANSKNGQTSYEEFTFWSANYGRVSEAHQLHLVGSTGKKHVVRIYTSGKRVEELSWTATIHTQCVIHIHVPWSMFEFFCCTEDPVLNSSPLKGASFLCQNLLCRSRPRLRVFILSHMITHKAGLAWRGQSASAGAAGVGRYSSMSAQCAALASPSFSISVMHKWSSGLETNRKGLWPGSFLLRLEVNYSFNTCIFRKKGTTFTWYEI